MPAGVLILEATRMLNTRSLTGLVSGYSGMANSRLNYRRAYVSADNLPVCSDEMASA